MRTFPIEYFFKPESLKKGDRIKLSETDFILIADTIQLESDKIISMAQDWCGKYCDLNNNGCVTLLKNYMSNEECKKNEWKTCYIYFYDENDIAWGHVYKLIKGGI